MEFLPLFVYYSCKYFENIIFIPLLGYFCSCSNGFYGVQCEASASLGVPCGDDVCYNGGQCVHATRTFCACPKGFLGDRCETKGLEEGSVACGSVLCFNDASCATAMNGQVKYILENLALHFFLNVCKANTL